jgi:hypothetical protein
MLTVRTLLLAQAPGANATQLSSVLGWIGALIGALVVLTLIIVFLRRKALKDDDVPVTTGGMMEHLRALRDQGKLSEDEYQSARALLAAKIKGMTLTNGAGANTRSGGRKPKPTPAPTLQTTPKDAKSQTDGPTQVGRGPVEVSRPLPGAIKPGPGRSGDRPAGPGTGPGAGGGPGRVPPRG